MPSGLTNEYITFQRMRNIRLIAFSWQTCLIYLVVVIVFSMSFDTNLKDVDMVLSKRQEAGVSLILKRCYSFTNSVMYLEHIITPSAPPIDEARVKRYSQQQRPWNVAKLRSFLKLRDPYRRFVPK